MDLAAKQHRAATMDLAHGVPRSVGRDLAAFRIDDESAHGRGEEKGNEPPNLVVGRSNVSLKQIWAFLSVAETGNFTKSAEALHTTQSAISTLI
jgi:hypothetical protein